MGWRRAIGCELNPVPGSARSPGTCTCLCLWPRNVCSTHHTALSRTNGQSRGSPMPGNVWTRTIIPFFRPFWPCRLLHAVLSTVASVVLPDRNNGWLFGWYTKSTGSSGMWNKFKKKFFKIWKPELGQQLGCNRTSQFCGYLSELLVEPDCLYLFDFYCYKVQLFFNLI